MAKMLDERIRRAVQEDVAIMPYNSEWPKLFLEEKEHLLTCLPVNSSANRALRKHRRARSGSISMGLVNIPVRHALDARDADPVQEVIVLE
jgi:hypothetical protein